MKYLNQYSTIKKIINEHQSFKETNWFVFTGAPSSGKTSSLNLLKETGFKVNIDLSRWYVESEMDKGLSINDIYYDEEELQKKIFLLMIENSLNLDVKDIIIHDYSLPDNIPFLKLSGLPISDEVALSVNMFQYRGIFLFEPLDIVRDGVRQENKEEQIRLFQLIRECYMNLGYTPILVKKDNLENRHRFLVKKINSILYE